MPFSWPAEDPPLWQRPHLHLCPHLLLTFHLTGAVSVPPTLHEALGVVGQEPIIPKTCWEGEGTWNRLLRTEASGNSLPRLPHRTVPALHMQTFFPHPLKHLDSQPTLLSVSIPSDQRPASLHDPNLQPPPPSRASAQTPELPEEPAPPPLWETIPPHHTGHCSGRKGSLCLRLRWPQDHPSRDPPGPWMTSHQHSALGGPGSRTMGGGWAEETQACGT